MALLNYQIYFLLPVALLLSILNLNGTRIPVRLIACFTTLGLLSWSSSPLLARLGSDLIVYRLKGDSLGTASRLLRESIKESLDPKEKLRIAGSTTVPIHHFEAEKQLATNRNLRLAIWGDSHWLWITPKKILPQPLTQLSASKLLSRKAELRIIWNPGPIGISTQPLADTGRFIASFVQGITPLVSGEISKQENTWLLNASFKGPTWTSNTHRAIMRWYVGTWWLAESLRDTLVDRASLACAIESFEIAAAILNNSTAPEFEAALYSNWATALYLLGDISLDNQSIRQARSYFGIARKKSGQLLRTRHNNSDTSVEKNALSLEMALKEKPLIPLIRLISYGDKRDH